MTFYSLEYDRAGRPIYHEVRVQQAGDSRQRGVTRKWDGFRHSGGYSETKRRRRYEWDVNHQLRKVTNELTKGTTMYSYDQFSNLVSARESGLETIFRTTDHVGNLYTTQDKSDRIYGAGSRLEQSGIDLKEKRNTMQGGYGKLVTKGMEFFYDEEGNLAKKVEPNGDTWTYLYFGNGMLKQVIRPDQSSVSFQYDPLGRRMEKLVTEAGGEDLSEQEEKMEKVIRFLWDGNTLLHEWKEDTVRKARKTKVKVDYQADYVRKLEEKEEQKARERAERGQRPPDSLITWIFQDDFIPRGKLTKDGNYSIISDYLGTPVEAYDEEGNKVWERELDIYGQVKPAKKDVYGRMEEEIGEKNFVPFRFQGQYEDEEIGLYYNRFRYYDPQNGQYTQQDPIGLAGGNPTLYGYVFNTLGEIDPFGLNPFNSVREALRYAKELAGIPRSQQFVRQWIVTGDVSKYGNSNYVVSNNKSAYGRYYEFVNANGEQRVVVLHTSDPQRDLHAHAGKPKDEKIYNFKDPDTRYKAIDDLPNNKDHHLDINCKG